MARATESDGYRRKKKILKEKVTLTVNPIKEQRRKRWRWRERESESDRVVGLPSKTLHMT